MPEKINLDQAFANIDAPWQPVVAGHINDVVVKLAKFEGEFLWHHHEDEDELFLVHKGRIVMQFRDGDVTLDPGEFVVVPRGVEHRPVGLTDDCEVIMIEPKGTLNTGNLTNERTVRDLKDIG